MSEKLFLKIHFYVILPIAFLFLAHVSIEVMRDQKMIVQADSSNPTYVKDIKPVFKDRCSQCHDKMGDRNWQEYTNAYNYKDAIKGKIVSKEMPLGKDMPQNERDLIVKWVNTGAKK